MLEEITISMQEYKELLITKGKYEELKSQGLKKSIDWNPRVTPLTMPTITYPEVPQQLTTITCNKKQSYRS